MMAADLEAQAKERMLAGVKRDPVAKLPQGSDTDPTPEPKTRDVIAEATGCCRPTLGDTHRAYKKFSRHI